MFETCTANYDIMVQNTKKVCKTRGTSEKIKKKLQFRVGGVHIDVTTLQRNAYFFFKMLNVSHVLQGLLVGTKFGGRCFFRFLGSKRYAKRVGHSTKYKKSSDFAWEGRTSMSPRCSEMHTFFEKLYMYEAFSMVLWHRKSRKKVCKTRDTSKNLIKKYWFRVGGVNIEVTTLQRKAYFLK